MLLSENDVRAEWLKKRGTKIYLPAGAQLTPAARDFLRSNRIEAVFGVEKPEHMTHLRGQELVCKDDARIVFRGEMDLLICETALAASNLKHNRQLESELSAIVEFERLLLAAEVSGNVIARNDIIGLSFEELRERSHHPDRYYGIKHHPVSASLPETEIILQRLRAVARQAELAAVRAFGAGNGARPDIITALNRLSSALYILALKSGNVASGISLNIGVSNRHIHLSRADLDVLFGRGYQLKQMKALSQPGQFAAEETVDIAGPKSGLHKVRILGPVRPETQAEISVTDCYKLGVAPVVRDSGVLDDSPGAEITGPCGRVTLKCGIIVASRHIHMHISDAERYGISDKQKVDVDIFSSRPALFKGVTVRVRDDFALEMHLDTDEANAVLWNKESRATVLR